MSLAPLTENASRFCNPHTQDRSGRCRTLGTRISLWLGQFDGVPLSHVFEVVAIVACEPDDHPVQWSPDERWTAVSLALTANWGMAPISTVHVVKAESGQFAFRLPGYQLCGSASWSPSGTRLLLRDESADVCVFDLLTDRIESVALLSGRAQAPWLADRHEPAPTAGCVGAVAGSGFQEPLCHSRSFCRPGHPALPFVV